MPCSDLFLETLQTFSEQGKTGLNLADAAIVYLAAKRANGLVLTFDKEFGQNSWHPSSVEPIHNWHGEHRDR